VLKMANNNSLRALKTGAILTLLVTIAACTSTESALQSNAAQNTATTQQPLATGIPEIARISERGGTKIAILVNNQPITSNDIKRRVAFVKLRRMKGNQRKIATDELVDEALKMQEARRIRVVATSKDVDAAYLRFAKSNKMPPAALTRILDQRGVTRRGFRDFIQAQMSWQRAVGARYQSDTAGSRRPQTRGQNWLPAVGSGAAQENEYTIQQVVFIVPKAKRSSLLKTRRAQAKVFRNRMRGCSNARTLAAELKDVTVLDRGRLLESQLPALWKKELITTGTGKVTRVRDTERGLEMLAVCNTRSVIGRSAGKDGDLFSGKNFQEAASELDKKYLAELKERAVIKRR